ncbi:hypothetical protein [Streptomyces griseoluteus]|uniref:hypothetical protein n=1 Tax=Streptomyces griseoluteus TaxID=29306 RepID=UPI00381B5688
MRCAHWRRVPLHLAREALEKWSADCVDAALQCQLSTHDHGEHYGLIDDSGERGTALWLRWNGRSEVELLTLPDCPAATPGPDSEGCCLFAHHTGQHSWEDGAATIDARQAD